jgi:peptide-methionine (R)-S-oxide reductase
MTTATSLAVAAIALSAGGLGVYAAQRQSAKENGILGWKIEDGRFAEGPYKGFLAENPNKDDRIEKTDSEWRDLLTAEQYRILRKQGTEPPFCSPFQDTKGDGVFVVAGTKQPVFKSDAKFDSGSGWPAFFQPYDMDSIWLRADTSHGMVRMEVLATRCDGHLGHVFTDGPRDKSGLRFCINSQALEFQPAEDEDK